MARSGLVDLIGLVRGMTDAGDSDYTIGTAVYWDDIHIQDVLDRHRADIYREPLTYIPKYDGGTVAWFTYLSDHGNYEKTTGGTAIFYIEDGEGNDVGTANYSMDYLKGIATFTSDTGGSLLYVTGRSYDLHASAADIWRQKAAHYAGAYTFSTDSQKFDRGQLIQNALRMADYYSGLVRPTVTVMYRDDIDDEALK